jgi:thiol-disulfide isomerase/thioredoxin
MPAKNVRQSQNLTKPTTRAERRAAERAHARRATQKRRLSRAQLLGGLVTALIVIGIIVYAVVQSNNLSHPQHRTAGPPLTNPKDLNPATSTLRVGSVAPNFTLHGVNGGSYTLAAQRGHPVLLEFFAVWCPHCQHEAPTIARLTKQYAPRGVRIWSILANPYGRDYDISGGTNTTLATKADVMWFTRTFHQSDPKLIDPTFHVVNKYGAGSYPTIYIINSKGIVTYVQQGEQPYSALAKALNSALANAPSR